MQDSSVSLISFKNYSFTYLGSNYPALESLTFSTYPGEFVLISGPSGSGKSTLLRAIIGLVPQMYAGKADGYIMVDGTDPAKTPIREMARRVGYVFQDPENQIFASTVEKDVSFGLEVRGLPKDEIKNKVKGILTKLGLTEVRERNVHELSDGQKQLVALAGVLSLDPKILIMDEPTSMLDPYNAKQTLVLVRQLADSLNICALVVEHRLGFSLPLADKFLIMNRGRLAFMAKPQDIKNILELKALGVSPPIPEPPVPVPDPPKSSRIALELDSVHYAYPNGTEALNGISLTVREQELIAIIGPNGSGKTTLVKHLNGILKPSSGSVRIFGIDTKKASVAELAKLVGVVFQNPDHQIFEETVEREVMFAPLAVGYSLEEAKRAALAAMKRMEILHLKDRDPLYLSGGEKKRVSIASVLSYAPRVLVFDEPTVGQDAQNRDLLRNLITELISGGRTVVVVTHDLNFIWPLDPRTIVMRDGKVIADMRLSQVMANRELAEYAHLLSPWLR